MVCGIHKKNYISPRYSIETCYAKYVSFCSLTQAARGRWVMSVLKFICVDEMLMNSFPHFGFFSGLWGCGIWREVEGQRRVTEFWKDRRSSGPPISSISTRTPGFDRTQGRGLVGTARFSQDRHLLRGASQKLFESCSSFVPRGDR